MYKTLAIEISIIFQVLANTLPENKTYAALVKEKGKLFKEINEAIQESIAVLKKNNDTEAVLGIEYMNQLKEQLKERNGTDITASTNDANIDTRRRNKITVNMAEIATFLQSNSNSKAKEKKKLAEDNRARIQKELVPMLFNQRLEGERMLNKRKKKLMIKEECPRWGQQKKKKKVASRRQDGGPTADKLYDRSNFTTTTKKVRQLKSYPCCRKCCKKSYMGCL